jgi:hypothetical protein
VVDDDEDDEVEEDGDVDEIEGATISAAGFPWSRIVWLLLRMLCMLLELFFFDAFSLFCLRHFALRFLNQTLI